MSLACLSAARSTIRRARPSASALSRAELDSRASSEWLRMTATIAPRLRSLFLKFVNSSDAALAGCLEPQPRRGRIQKRGAD